MVKGFGIRPHEIVMNYVSGTKSYWVDDQDLAPESYAEQFIDPDPTKALPVSELLRRARMIIATELGKDPLLRQVVRQKFKAFARVSVLPTERGLNKIDEHHPYFVRLYFSMWHSYLCHDRRLNTFLTNQWKISAQPTSF
jgi:transcription elongation factor SPT6